MNTSVKIIIAGDLFPTPVNEDLFVSNEIEKVFDKKILDLINDSDYSVCNLEGCLTNSNSIVSKTNYWIKTKPEAIRGIKRVGFKAVSLANNHSSDFGNEGLNDTIQILEDVGIKWFGAGLNVDNISTHTTCQINGLTFTFYGVSETIFNIPSKTDSGANLFHEYTICRELSELKRKCDYLIVLYHGGTENFHYITETIRDRFHHMSDAGADIIISQHTHAIGLEEYYKQSYFLYGQGNFCFHFTKKIHEWNRQGLLSEFEFTKDGFNVTHHVVRRDGAKVLYDTQQDLAEFNNRTELLKKGVSFSDEFKTYSRDKLIQYLNNIYPESFFDKLVRHVIPYDKYLKYVSNRYSKKELLWLLQIIRSDEFREIAIQGLEDAVESDPGKK